jgi:hypothetical protein
VIGWHRDRLYIIFVCTTHPALAPWWSSWYIIRQADLTWLQLAKCHTHLVSWIKNRGGIVNPLLHTMLAFLKVSYRMVRITLRNNKNLPGTEQTALDVIAWVRSQVYRHSPLAYTGLLIKTWWDYYWYDEGTTCDICTFIYRLLGRMVWSDDIMTCLISNVN